MSKRNYGKIIKAIPSFFASEEDGYTKLTVGDTVEVIRPTEKVDEMSDNEIILMLVELFKATQKADRFLREEEQKEALREARRDRRGGKYKWQQL